MPYFDLVQRWSVVETGRDLESEIGILNKMLNSLVDILVERGVLTEEEVGRNGRASPGGL